MKRPLFIPDRNGFTLFELLMVISIMALLSAFLIPNISNLSADRNATLATYDLAGSLDQARTYALANNTYVWVGFFEEDGSKSSQTPAVSGVGRLVISIVASEDGTRYSDSAMTSTLPAAFGAGDSSNQVKLVQVSKLIRLSNVHAVANNAGDAPTRPSVVLAYQVGEPPSQAPDNSGGAFAIRANPTTSNPTTFTYPLASGAGTPQYTFAKIIEFNPQGEASKIGENVFTGPGPQDIMEIALQPTHGTIIGASYSGVNQTKSAAAIQVEGLTGRIRIYRL